MNFLKLRDKNKLFVKFKDQNSILTFVFGPVFSAIFTCVNLKKCMCNKVCITNISPTTTDG